MRSARRYDLGSLECVVHAAAPCPAHVKRRIIDWFGPVIREYYGATEIGIVIVCDSDEWLAHEGTVGHPFGGSDIHVHDAEGRLLATGETGEVFIRPPDYWPGFTYLGQDDKRREIERDGYISIGDVGRVDADGYLYLSDRARDMVISGGVNIYPAEIEALPAGARRRPRRRRLRHPRRLLRRGPGRPRRRRAGRRAHREHGARARPLPPGRLQGAAGGRLRRRSPP